MLASVEASRISPEELYQLMAGERQPTVLDVRRALARDSSDVIPGALCVELDKLRAMAPRLGSGPVVVYCDCPDEAGALKAASILEKIGVADVRVLVGGYDGWAGMLTRQRSRPSETHFPLRYVAFHRRSSSAATGGDGAPMSVERPR